MPSLAALVILIISLWLCSIIDGLPHLLPSLSGLPLWFWLLFSLTILSWLMKDG